MVAMSPSPRSRSIRCVRRCPPRLTTPPRSSTLPMFLTSCSAYRTTRRIVSSRPARANWIPMSSTPRDLILRRRPHQALARAGTLTNSPLQGWSTEDNVDEKPNGSWGDFTWTDSTGAVAVSADVTTVPAGTTVYSFSSAGLPVLQGGQTSLRVPSTACTSASSPRSVSSSRHSSGLTPRDRHGSV
jgi:hypothetical protein